MYRSTIALLQLQGDSCYAAWEHFGCESELSAEPEHFPVIRKYLSVYFVQSFPPCYLYNSLHKLLTKTFPLKPVVDQGRNFSRVKIRVEDKSHNTDDFSLPLFGRFSNHRNVPVVVYVAKHDEPIVGHLFKSREEPCPPGLVGQGGKEFALQRFIFRHDRPNHYIGTV